LGGGGGGEAFEVKAKTQLKTPFSTKLFAYHIG
jgi:hypothetical protein